MEIVKKLNEIKYLTSQKKVPRLSLRKEIIHLESQLQVLFKLEEKLALQKKKETLAAASYKKQIAQLKKRLQASEDKKLQQKVDKLSQLLAEYMAKEGTTKEVEKVQKYLGKPLLKVVRVWPQLKAPILSRQEFLAQKIAELKNRLEQGKMAPELRLGLERKLAELELRLPGKEPGEVKHTLWFEEPKPAASEPELPIPPPPRKT